MRPVSGPIPMVIVAVLCAGAAAEAQTPAPRPDGVARMLRQVERALEASDPTAFRALVQPASETSDTTVFFIADWIVPGITRAVVQERLRTTSQNVPSGEGYDLYVDVLAESGRTGRVGTWLIETRRDASAPDTWRISKLTVLTTLRGLYRLQLNPAKEFTIENLKFSAEDFEVRIPQGLAFLAEVEEGVTAVVLLGKGDLTFSPPSPAEKGQVKIFSGSEQLQARFDWLYVRINPDEFEDHIPTGALKARPPDRRDMKRADEIFQENVNRSFGLELGDLSRERWSVVPKYGDFVTEIQSDKAHLTYMRSGSDPEDIRFFDRTRQRTISIYSSKNKLARRGRFYSEDDQVDFDILKYDINASFDPQREWIDATARVLVGAKRTPVSSLVMSLAEPLVIRSVISRRFGYLMALRVSGQNDVVINLPEPLVPNTILDLEFTYGGRLHAVPPEREALDFRHASAPESPAAQDESEFFSLQTEPSYIYTGRSVWYPQGPVSDYSTANLVLRVPENYSSVASGALDAGFPKLVPVSGRVWKEYQFSVTQPVRYMAWATSHFVHVDSTTLTLPAPPEPPKSPPLAGVSYNTIDISVESSGMLKRRALELSETAQDVLKFYGGLLDDIPYQSFSLAVVERSTPGGHSPPYFAALSQPPPATPIAWRTDPAYFSEFPEFFVAHETAHQWWGQAVGWKNYHEQWLSEGFAQYFAALYAERSHRKDVFDRVIGQMTKWTIDRSDQGPVYLGYRLGHIKNDSRVFRALVYNKGGIVLHMLRRLVGDDVFFRGLKRYYATWRFRKAGTEDLRAAFEAEASRPLDRFFDRWIYNASLPHMKFTYKIEPDAVTVRFEQIGETFDVPVTVSLETATATNDVVLPLSEPVTELRIPTKGVVRDVVVNRDNAAPIVFVK